MSNNINLKPLEKQTDEELIFSFQQGDAAAFDLLVGRYKNQLMNYVFRFVGNYDECDDIVQETFVRVYYKKHTFKPIAKFSTWIYTIASNLAKTRLRQRDRQKLFSFFQKQCPEEEFEIADKKYDLDRITDAIMVEEIVQNALTKIPKKYREAVVLRDIQDMTYEDIATILHTNTGTVKSRINRGRALLKELLKNYKF